jgi:hypothetical protein
MRAAPIGARNLFGQGRPGPAPPSKIDLNNLGELRRVCFDLYQTAYDLARRCFSQHDELKSGTQQPNIIRNSTLFHWWPCERART